MKQIDYVKLASTSPQLEIYSVRINNVEAFVIRFELESLLDNSFYVRMTTQRPELLTPSVLKELRTKFQTIAAKLSCQCEDPLAERFTRFFGFTPVGHIGSITSMRIG